MRPPGAGRSCAARARRRPWAYCPSSSARAFTSYLGQRPQLYDRLAEAYPGQLRALLQWGLPHRDRLVRAAGVSAGELSRYMIDELARVVDMATVALLHAYLPDPELGPMAVEAIRTIERRL